MRIKFSNKLHSLLIIHTFLILFSIQPLLTISSPVRDYWPTTGWITTTPEEQNLDSEKLEELEEYLLDYPLDIHSLIITRHGYLVYEKYYDGFSSSSKHAIWSVTKSIMSSLYGIALDNGYFDNLSQTVLSFFQDRVIANNSTWKDEMNLNHLLTMSSGIFWPADSLYWYSWLNSDDQIQFVLNLTMGTKPGTEFSYNTGSSHLLSAILENVTGQSTLDFARTNLFDKIGITDIQWDTDKSGLYFGGHGLHLRPLDMTKFGYLYLNNGTWNDEQIVSEEWVNSSSTAVWTINGEVSYGRYWWIRPNSEMYMAIGYEGQYIYIIPKYDMVVAITAKELFDLPHGAILHNYLYEAITVLSSKVSLNTIISLLIVVPIIIINFRSRKSN